MAPGSVGARQDAGVAFLGSASRVNTIAESTRSDTTRSETHSFQWGGETTTTPEVMEQFERVKTERALRFLNSATRDFTVKSKNIRQTFSKVDENL